MTNNTPAMEKPLCKLCGEPMPKGEEMFQYHGYSGPCPKPPVPSRNDWRSERVDNDEGDIVYEAHGPRDSFVCFEGPNAKADCDVFMKAVSTPPLTEAAMEFERRLHDEGFMLEPENDDGYSSGERVIKCADAIKIFQEAWQARASRSTDNARQSLPTSKDDCKCVSKANDTRLMRQMAEALRLVDDCELFIPAIRTGKNQEQEDAFEADDERVSMILNIVSKTIAEYEALSAAKERGG